LVVCLNNEKLRLRETEHRRARVEAIGRIFHHGVRGAGEVHKDREEREHNDPGGLVVAEAYEEVEEGSDGCNQERPERTGEVLGAVHEPDTNNERNAGNKEKRTNASVPVSTRAHTRKEGGIRGKEDDGTTNEDHGAGRIEPARKTGPRIHVSGVSTEDKRRHNDDYDNGGNQVSPKGPVDEISAPLALGDVTATIRLENIVAAISHWLGLGGLDGAAHKSSLNRG